MFGIAAASFTTVLPLAVAAAMPPMRDPAPDARALLDRAAKSGDLMLVDRDRRGVARERRIVEVDIRHCLVAFKTRIDANGFTASMSDLGKDSALSFARAEGRIEIRSASDPAGLVTLHAERAPDAVLQALEDVRAGCRDGERLF